MDAYRDDGLGGRPGPPAKTKKNKKKKKNERNVHVCTVTKPLGAAAVGRRRRKSTEGRYGGAAMNRQMAPTPNKPAP